MPFQFSSCSQSRNSCGHISKRITCKNPPIVESSIATKNFNACLVDKCKSLPPWTEANPSELINRNGRQWNVFTCQDYGQSFVSRQQLIRQGELILFSYLTALCRFSSHHIVYVYFLLGTSQSNTLLGSPYEFCCFSLYFFSFFLLCVSFV